MESIMKTKILAALLVAASATLAAPAFASGYGPAPFYRPSVGAPGAAERADANANTNSSYGGVNQQTSQSGSAKPVTGLHSVFFGH
jgi:hypothetical protein